MTVYITDKKKTADLELVPDFTGNTWTTEDEIEEWNNGSSEDAGFHWNEELDRWETDSENFEWWKELEEGRQKAYSVFESPEYSVYSEERNGFYWEFCKWFSENPNELEDEKDMYSMIPDFVETIKAGEIEGLGDDIADKIQAAYEVSNK